jgi:hypothetical protein
MLIVRRRDQTGSETEKGTGNVIVRENGIGKLLKRGLLAETSGSLVTGGRDILLRPMKGTGLYHITPAVSIMVLIIVVPWI